jgi:hypothetical protein
MKIFIRLLSISFCLYFLDAKAYARSAFDYRVNMINSNATWIDFKLYDHGKLIMASDVSPAHMSMIANHFSPDEFSAVDRHNKNKKCSTKLPATDKFFVDVVDDGANLKCEIYRLAAAPATTSSTPSASTTDSRVCISNDINEDVQYRFETDKVSAPTEGTVANGKSICQNFPRGSHVSGKILGHNPSHSPYCDFPIEESLQVVVGMEKAHATPHCVITKTGSNSPKAE